MQQTQHARSRDLAAGWMWVRCATALAGGASIVLTAAGALASPSGIGGYSGNPAVNGGAICTDCHGRAFGAVIEIIDAASGSTA